MELAKFLALSVELALLFLIIDLFRIETTLGLVRLFPLILGGFVVNAWLPYRFRLPFFLLLSFAAIIVILGFEYGIGLIVLGLILIGIAHLPIPFFIRIVLLVSFAFLLNAIRNRWTGDNATNIIFPVLGSMFMFRLIVYLYDLRHEKKRASIWQRLSYFFLLPNVCFPIFPVVDYQAFRRTYYDGDPFETYQKGVRWIFRGVTHLLFYRLLYHNLVPVPSEVADLGGVVLFTTTSYMLYVRISGQFHIIVGILCLFGFNLPRTHHLFFFASSFTDLWRRINIYWKDFMAKIVFYPVYALLRKLGTMPALAISTVIVFIATWLLHSYQWFWLRGAFPMTLVNALFWGILGLLVLVNTLYELKYGRKRSLARKSWKFRPALVRSAQSIGMFCTMSVLWSLWGSESVGQWLSVMATAGNSGVGAYALLLLGVVAVLMIGVLGQYVASRKWTLPAFRLPTFPRTAAMTTTAIIALALLGQTGVDSRLGPKTAGFLQSLREDRLNRRDEDVRQRGYYEALQGSYSFATALWMNELNPPKGWFGEYYGGRYTRDIRRYVLSSNFDGEYKREEFRTNRWAMRDKDYEKEKPESTYRIALLGASYEMGGGIKEADTFQAVAEALLNENNAGGRYTEYEILNFAVEGFSLLQSFVHCEEHVLQFAPDAVIVTGHGEDLRRMEKTVWQIVKENRQVPYDGVREIIADMNVDRRMNRTEIRRRSGPHLGKLIQWSLDQIAELCRENGAIPIWVYVPDTQEIRGGLSEGYSKLARRAESSGYITMTLDGAYDNLDFQSVILAPWDFHPNAIGNRRLGGKLYEALVENEVILKLGLSANTGRESGP